MLNILGQPKLDTHANELLPRSDQLVAEASSYATHNKNERRTFMRSVESELAILAIRKVQIYVLDHQPPV
jgi:hypothetical protein